MLDLKKQDRQESYYILRLAWVAGCASAIAFGFLLNDVTHGVFSYTISQFLPHPPFWWTGSKITCLQESSDQVGSLEAGTRCHELWSGQRPRWGLNHPRMLWKSLWGKIRKDGASVSSGDISSEKYRKMSVMQSIQTLITMSLRPAYCQAVGHRSKWWNSQSLHKPGS